VRICLTHYITWSVNSVCHLFGRQAYATNDRSRNEWVVGLLAFGEGWHTNHHAFPRSAFHGRRWWQVDAAGYLVRLLERLRVERLRLARDVYRIPPALKARMVTGRRPAGRADQLIPPAPAAAPCSRARRQQAEILHVARVPAGDGRTGEGR
jgi:hypothetical protein